MKNFLWGVVIFGTIIGGIIFIGGMIFARSSGSGGRYRILRHPLLFSPRHFRD